MPCRPEVDLVTGPENGVHTRCKLIYLPSYSPDFNPIEQAFSKLKSYLREACARSYEALTDVIGEALPTISALDAESFFDHCGYRTVVQSL
jgi:transposase